MFGCLLPFHAKTNKQIELKLNIDEVLDLDTQAIFLIKNAFEAAG